MSYPPLKLQHQLDGTAQAGHDCGPRTVSMEVAFATGNRLVPGVNAIRIRMHKLKGDTTSDQHVRALDSYGITGNRKHNAPWERALQALRNPDAILGLLIDYSVVNRLVPRLTGDPRFMGAHWFAARLLRPGLHSDDKVKVFDPLADGRRKGIDVGPSLWPVSALKAACGAYTGVAGTWSGVIVQRPTLPPEPPPAPCEEQLADAQERIAELEEALARRRDRPLVKVSSGAASGQ